jgi:hypothetical protein
MDILPIVVGLILAAGAFAIGRELICWYFKMNEFLDEFRSYRGDVRTIRRVLTAQFGEPAYTAQDVARMSFDDMTSLAEQMGLKPEKMPTKLEAQILAAQAAASGEDADAV